MFNVRDFGAVGDWAHDDFPATQRAVDVAIEGEDFIADRPRWERFWALIEAEDAARAADERESV